MKNIIIIFLVSIINIQNVFSEDSKHQVAYKKHELNIALHYAQHKNGDHPLEQITIFSPDGLYIADYQKVGKKVGRGISMRAQYNYFFKRKIFFASSINMFFYSPMTVHYDWTKNSNTYITRDIFHPILSKSDNKGKLNFTANQFYADFGLGFVPIIKNRFSWRLGLGFCLGYHSFTDPIVSWAYDYIYLPEDDQTYLNFHGFRSNTLSGVMVGGYGQTSFNVDIVPDKIAIGLDYKFTITNSWFKNGVFPQNVGVQFNVKL